jgi:hypothetical protein
MGEARGSVERAQAANSVPIAAAGALRFSLGVDGIEIASFTELVAITSDVDVPESKHAATVTLRRGLLTSTMELWAWHQTLRAEQETVARRSVTLTMYAGDQAVAKYWLSNAAPIRLEVASLKEGASEALYETVTLDCESIQRVSPD